MENEERLNDLVPLETIIKYLRIEKEQLLKQNKALQVQLGQERAYSEELEDTITKLKLQINNLKLNNKEWSKDIKREETYNNLKNQLALANKRIKSLKNLRNDLIGESYKYKLILHEDNLI